MDYLLRYFGLMNAMVSIYHVDGSVAISHGGIEMGQGIHTKVAQVAAHILGIPLDLICVKPTNNFIGVNSYDTGGCFTSEVVAYVRIQFYK